MIFREINTHKEKSAIEPESKIPEMEIQETVVVAEAIVLEKKGIRKNISHIPRWLGTKIVSLYRDIANLFASKAISLFINDTDISLLMAKGERIKKYARVSLETGLIKDGVIINPPEVSAKIDELFTQTRLKNRKRVTICLTGLNCLTKVITIPPVSKSVLTEAVQRESERELPMPMSSIYLSWQVIQRSTDEIKIFVLAQNKPVIDELIKTLKMSRIKPYFVDLAPIALSRLPDDRLSIIADIRESEADIVVVENGTPSFIRGIPFPLTDSVETKAAILTEELHRIMKYYRSKKAMKQPDSGLCVFVSGGLARDRSLLGVLSERLKHEIISLDSPLISPANFEIENYMVNIGSVLRQINHVDSKKTLVDVNLLPEIYRAKNVEATKLLAVPLSVIAVALFAFLVLQTLNLVNRTDELQAQYNELDSATVQQMQQRMLGQKAIKEYQQNIDALTQQIGNFNSVHTSFEGEKTTIDGAMALLMQDESDFVQLDNLKYSNDVISLSGSTLDEDGVLGYVYKLGLIYGQDNVKLMNMAGSGEIEKFNILIDTEGD